MSREEEIIKSIQRVLEEHDSQLQGFKVVLFGSRARGNSDPRSDFDVGVMGREPMNLQTFYEINDQLDNLDTLFRIDWVDLHRVSPDFRNIALTDSLKLYE
jgi:predicted nucleotidyltransferase